MLKFEMPTQPLDESAIRYIVREAEIGMADGVDPKASLVEAAQNYLAMEFAREIKAAAEDAMSLADMVGAAPDFTTCLPEGVVIETLGDLDTFANAPDAGCYAAAKAAVKVKPVLGMHRGKWLSKLGIVKAHIDAIGSPSAPRQERDPYTVAQAQVMLADVLTPPSGEPSQGLAEVEQPDVTDPEMREMLGLSPIPEVIGAAIPLSADAAQTHDAAAPHTTGSSASSAGGSPPPPEPVNPGDAYVLFNEAINSDDGALAKRLGVGRSTVHNYLSGRTAKVKCTQAQARVMAAEIDVRVSKLRRAAEIFAAVRD